MDTETALVKAGYNVSTAEGEFNQQSFQVVAYGQGDSLDIEGFGTLDLSWVEPDPPEVKGKMTTTVPACFVGQSENPEDAEVNAEVTAILDALNVETMEVKIEGVEEPVKAWHCRARYTWTADFDW